MNVKLKAGERMPSEAARNAMPRPRPEAIERPELDAALASALQSVKLVLLCAPAGFGKTTALVRQLARPVPRRMHAWLSVSEDDDLPSLLAGLLDALAPLGLPWRQSPLEWPSQVLKAEGAATVAAALLQALQNADADHGVIVLDDLHRVSDPRALAFLDLLIPRLSSRWTLAITSREPPPLALARLRLHGELAEFGQAQLGFGRDDLRRLLARHEQATDESRVEQLWQATQGWPVGAATMAQSQKPAELGGVSRDQRRRMFDYLASEVLDGLPQPMREFLLRCSVLRELSAARCAQVSGDDRAAHWLEALERRDLFVCVLDAEEPTLRLHELFREFLEARLLLELPDEHATLLRRAAQGEPDLAHRVALHLRAGALETALQDVMEHAADIVLAGGDAQLLRVLEQFPPDLRETAPELAFARGVHAWNHFRWQTMLQAMLRAADGFERQGRASLVLQARAFAVLALNFVGRVDDALRLWQSAPREAETPQVRVACSLADHMTSVMNGPAQRSPQLMWRVVEALSTSHGMRWVCFHTSYTVMGRWGMRAPTQALAQALIDAAGEERPRLKTTAVLLQAWLALWRADFEGLRRLREPLEREAGWLGDPMTLSSPLQYMRAFEKHVRGEPDEALALMQGLCDAAQRDPERRSSNVYRHLVAAFAVASGRWEQAAAEAEALRAQQDEGGASWPYLPIALACLEAELALHRHEPEAAQGRLRPLLSRVADVDALATHTRLRIGLARAETRLGRTALAWRVLAPVLQELRNSGEPLGLLMLGPAALDELAQARWPRSANPGLIGLLQEVAALAHRLNASEPAEARPFTAASAFSERERQVLALVAEGHSNKSIARELGLSPHTVKRHVARILERTGQASRMAAATWYLRQGDTARG